MWGDFIIFIGETIKKRYFILDRIGSCGEGTMYLAKDLEIGVLRAVKEVPKSGRKEARLLKLLDYPSLPGMIDYEERDDFCYLVMEYIRGDSLGSMLKKGYEFSPEEILRIGMDLLGILEYLHSLAPAVYYGDLKPDNILMSQEGNLYLVDFGSAVFDYGNPEFVCKGTKGFAAPEQYEGKITAASDIYGLGRTLGKLSEACRWRMLRQYPKFLLFLYRCCRHDRKKRWQTAAKARDYLGKIHSLRIQLRVLLAAAAAGLCTLAAVFSLGISKKTSLPEMRSMLQVVCGPCYSMRYRSGSSGIRRMMEKNMEENLLRMLRFYKEENEQIRLWELLTANSEMQKSAERAELYYRQLFIYHRDYDRGLEAYSRFLIRQEKTELQNSEKKEEETSGKKKVVSDFSEVELGGFDVNMDLGGFDEDSGDWDDSEDSFSSTGNLGTLDSSAGEEGSFSSGDLKTGQTGESQTEPTQSNSEESRPGQTESSGPGSGQTDASGSSIAQGESEQIIASGQEVSGKGESRQASGETKNLAGTQEAAWPDGNETPGNPTSHAPDVDHTSPTQMPEEKLSAGKSASETLTPKPSPTAPLTPTPLLPAAALAPEDSETTVYEPEDLLLLVKEGLLNEKPCVHPLALSYLKKEQLPAGEIRLILNQKSVQGIVSLRINGKEADWKWRNEKLCIYCPEEINEMEAVLLCDPEIHGRIIQRMLY